MKTNRLLTILLMCISFAGFAQGKKHFPKLEELQERKWKYLSEQAQFSANDIQAVWPLFKDFENKMWEIHDKKRIFFQSVHEMESDSKINFKTLNDQYIELETNELKLIINYHKMLSKSLSAPSLFKYYRAEKEFKNFLLQSFKGRKMGHFNN